LSDNSYLLKRINRLLILADRLLGHAIKRRPTADESFVISSTKQKWTQLLVNYLQEGDEDGLIDQVNIEKDLKALAELDLLMNGPSKLAVKIDDAVVTTSIAYGLNFDFADAPKFREFLNEYARQQREFILNEPASKEWSWKNFSKQKWETHLEENGPPLTDDEDDLEDEEEDDDESSPEKIMADKLQQFVSKDLDDLFECYGLNNEIVFGVLLDNVGPTTKGHSFRLTQLHEAKKAQCDQVLKFISETVSIVNAIDYFVCTEIESAVSLSK